MGVPEPPALGASLLAKGSFDGQTVIVTGGGTGLGKAIALEFARVGASIAILSRGEEHRAAGVAAVRGAGSARARGRLRRAPGRRRWPPPSTRSSRELGLASVLVNNAAGNFPVPAEDLSPNGWRAVVDSVLTGTFLCSREFGRRHIAAGTPGSIVNIGAAYAWTGGPGFAHSAAAKAGVKNLTETLAVEWGPYGIRVNALVPGLFPHEDEVAAIRGVPERGKAEDRRAPAGRVGRPRELGWAATFLASPFAAYITGTHAGRRWRQLAAPRDADARVRPDPRAARQGALLADLTRRPDSTNPPFVARRSAARHRDTTRSDTLIRMQQGSQGQPTGAGLRDPVCGMTVAETSPRRLQHAGLTYFFCSDRCRERFRAEPERWLTSPPAQQPASAAAAGGYTCPMHPEICAMPPARARSAAWRSSPGRGARRRVEPRAARHEPPLPVERPARRCRSSRSRWREMASPRAAHALPAASARRGSSSCSRRPSCSGAAGRSSSAPGARFARGGSTCSR